MQSLLVKDLSDEYISNIGADISYSDKFLISVVTCTNLLFITSLQLIILFITNKNSLLVD